MPFIPSPTSARLAAAAALLLTTFATRAEEPAKPEASAPAATAQAAAPKPDLTVAPPAAAAPAVPSGAEPAAPPTNRWIGYLEVVGVNLTLNLGGRIVKPEETSYNFTLETWKDNLNGPWEYDGNSYRTNQYAHPYEGSMFMNSCRSTGLQFWEGMACTFVGSYIWETFMEIHPPSINDQITTTIGGGFLGEVLFRLSTDILDGAGDEKPDFWRNFASFAVSPVAGINRGFYGDKYRERRFKGYPQSGEFALSVSLTGKAYDAGNDQPLSAGTVRLQLRMMHGLPTDDGWKFRRPFDHYDISTSLNLDQNAFTNASGVNLLIRGLLLGGHYGEGVSSGLWGLWGAYDVVTAAQMRASTSALAFGTVKQWAPSPSTRLLATAYLGAGFGAAGTSAQVEDKRDYHFGAQAVGLVDLKFLYANRFRTRFSVREYVTGDQLSPDQGGYEDLTYALADFTYRIAGRHALGLEVLGGLRQASYPDIPDAHQKFRQLSVTYSFVGEKSMGSGSALDL